jgi:Holliday junction DNA helicase RuvB
MQLRTVIAGAQLQGRRIPHCLLVGGPGLGKTTLAQIVADEVGVELIRTSGMQLKKSADLVGLLLATEGKPCCVFIDEIHAAKKECQETIYGLLEDGAIDVLGGSGPDTVATTQALPGVIIVGATTAPGKLTQPFRDRFGFIGVMGEYSQTEIATIVQRFWKSRDVKSFKGETMAVAQRAKGVPRRAIHLAERVLDFAAISESETVNSGMTADALSIFGIDSNGLDRQDIAVLRCLVKDFSGRPTGVDAIAQRLCMDVSTLSDSIEPYLAQAGYLVRTKGGRVATAKAHELVRSTS